MATVKVLTWEGDQTVDKAVERKNELLKAFGQAHQVVVSLSLLGNVDLSFIQLLVSASLTARRNGKRFSMKGTVKPEFARSLVAAGYLAAGAVSANDVEAVFAAAGGEPGRP